MAAKSLVVIYVYGCITCGRVGRKIRQVTQYCQQNKIGLMVLNSKEDNQARSDHRQFLIEKQLPTELYTAIIVDGNKVTRLLEWNS